VRWGQSPGDYLHNIVSSIFVRVYPNVTYLHGWTVFFLFRALSNL
jgi:hypothetical protein